MVAPAGSPPLCFFHVQKCGGTSLKAAIRSGFAPRASDDLVIDLDAAAATRAAESVGVPNFELRDLVLAYHLAARSTRAVMGHFRYTESAHACYRETARMVTVLRQPEARLLSAYYYDRYKAEDYGKITHSLRDFLLTGDEPSTRARVHAEKYIVFFRGDGDVTSRVASPADVDAAIRNLTAMSAVGFLEDLDPFLGRLSEWADEPLEMPELNKSPANDSQRSELTDELRDVVKEICAPAQIVYDRVRDHFLG